MAMACCIDLLGYVVVDALVVIALHLDLEFMETELTSIPNSRDQFCGCGDSKGGATGLVLDSWWSVGAKSILVTH
jgi:hypothetical protein